MQKVNKNAKPLKYLILFKDDETYTLNELSNFKLNLCLAIIIVCAPG